MSNRIKTFSNGSYLFYGRGRFDDWCVYFTNASGEKKVPKDKHYFCSLRKMARKHGVKKVYEDFVQVYDLAGEEVKQEDLETISKISEHYQEDALLLDILFSILYMAMISEERKAFSILGKRIKRLGIHILLWENATLDYACNFMKGMRWREISALCEARGF